MIPMEPSPEDFARQLAERRAQILEVRSIAHCAFTHRAARQVRAAVG
jgi:hypothetical protein